MFCIQLMTHYANEYYDVETDRRNANRTWFSGGSGVLVLGSIPPAAAKTATLLFALASTALIIAAGIQVPALWLLGITALAMAWSYSGPPFMLVKTGWGELSASLVVAGMVPLVGYLMQSGGVLRPTILVPLLPLILLHFAMLIAFQIPDRDADRSAGKRTIAVRLNLLRTVQIHNAALFVAFCVIVALALAGWPGARIAWLPVPVAIWQAARTGRLLHLSDHPPGYHWFTFRALFLFALTTALWLAGVGLHWIR